MCKVDSIWFTTMSQDVTKCLNTFWPYFYVVGQISIVVNIEEVIWPSGHSALQLFNTALTYLEQHLICEVCVPVGSCSLPMLDYWDLCRKEFNTKLNNRYKEKFPQCCILSSVTSVTVKLQNYAVISSGNTAFYLRRHHRVLSVTVKLQNCAVITSGSADTKWIECDCIQSLPKIKLRNCLMQ